MTPREFLKKYPNKTLHDYFVSLESHRKKSEGETFSSNLNDKFDNSKSQRGHLSNSYHISVTSAQLKRKLLLITMIVITIFTIIINEYLFLLLIIPFVWSGLINACPNCSTWFVRKRLSKEEIDRFNFYVDVTRSDKIKDNAGKIVGEIERKEQVTRTRISYLNTYCCQHCGLVWNNRTSEIL